MKPVTLRRSELPARTPDARELLHALLDHADLTGFAPDGGARLTLIVPPDLFADLEAWEADEREDEGLDEPEVAA